MAYQLTEGGVLEITERADGSGVAVLAAVNTRAANDCHYAHAA